jgi:hypothetical protein
MNADSTPHIRPDWGVVRFGDDRTVSGPLLADLVESLEIAAAQLQYVCPMCAKLGATCGACSTRVRILAHADEEVRLRG